MDSTFTYYTWGYADDTAYSSIPDNLAYDATHPMVDFSGTLITETPTIWYTRGGYQTRAGEIFKGPSTLQKITFGMGQNANFHQSSSLSLKGTFYPNLIYLVLNGNLKISSIDLTGQRNLDITTLSASLTAQTLGTLTIQRAIWSQLSSSVKDTCIENIGTILIIEEEQNA